MARAIEQKLGTEFSNFMEMNKRNETNKQYAKLKYDKAKQLVMERQQQKVEELKEKEAEE